jgi:hypothetical protein
MKICPNKYIHGPKSEIPETFIAFTHTKKVEIGSFIKARIQIRPKRSGSDRIRIRNTVKHCDCAQIIFSKCFTTCALFYFKPEPVVIKHLLPVPFGAAAAASSSVAANCLDSVPGCDLDSAPDFVSSSCLLLSYISSTVKSHLYKLFHDGIVREKTMK